MPKLLRLLIVFALLLACGNAYSQNAFYRARKIVAWRDSIFLLNDAAIETADVAKRKRLFLDSINSVVFYYAGQGSWDKFQPYPAMKQLYDTLFQLTTGIEDIRALVTGKRDTIAVAIAQTIDSIDVQRMRLKTLSESLSGDEQKMNDLTKRKDSVSAFDYSQDSGRLNASIAVDKVSIKRVQVSIDSLTQQYQQQRNSNPFRDFVSKRASAVQKGVMKNYDESKVDISGFGYTNNVKMSVEKATQTALFDNRAALPPLKNFSFPSQTEIIDALAIYLAKRVKQEMVLGFTDQLKKSLKADTLISAFFPETRKLFMSLPDDEFARFGTAWRYAISKDFVQLPDNFMQNSKTKTWLGVEAYPYFFDAYQVAVLIRKKYNFIEMIDELNTLNEDGSKYSYLRTETMQQFVQMTNVINKELFNRDTTGLYWLDGDNWGNLSREEFDVFWALTNERYAKFTDLMVFRNGDNKYQLVDLTYANLKNWIKRILFALNKFQRDQKELYDQVQSTAGAQDSPWEFRIATYWDNVEDVMRMVIDNKLLNGQYQTTIDKAMKVTDGLFNVYESIQRKNYVSAVDETLALIELFVKDPKPLTTTQWQQLFTSNLANIDGKNLFDYLDAEYNNLAVDSVKMKPSALLKMAYEHPADATNITDQQSKDFNRYLRELGTKNEVLQGLEWRNGMLTLGADNVLYRQFFKNSLVANLTVARKAASIFQDIILANGSKELSMVIEKYAMPVGSYKVKRRSRWSVDLNAYFGVYGGYEWAQQPGSNSYRGAAGGVLGFTAPIGFTYSWAGYTGKGNTNEGYSVSAKKGLRRFNGSSHSISFTIIDIGAVVSYRFTNAADAPLPEKVTWGQVISPGLFYRYGIKNTPLCAHLGAQFAPQLRTINDVKNQNTIRATLGVTMDLPLLNLGKGR